MADGNFWQLLPRDFQLNVVAHLDYKTRCCLQKCSKSDKALVELCSVKIDYLKMQIEYNKKAKLIFNNSMETKEYEIDEVINDIPSIFKKTSSIIQVLEIDSFARPSVIPVVKKILEKLSVVRTKKLHFRCNNFQEDEVFVNFVKLIDVKILEGLLICHRLPRTCLDLLTETEQWKNLKKIGFGEVENPNIDFYLHLEKIRFEVRKMLPEDVWKLVQQFQKPLPIGSYFDITVNHDADVDDILTYFRKKGVDVRSNPVRPGDEEKYIHTQRFVIPKTKSEEDHVLIVRMNNSRVYGWVGEASLNTLLLHDLLVSRIRAEHCEHIARYPAKDVLPPPLPRHMDSIHRVLPGLSTGFSALETSIYLLNAEFTVRVI